MLWTSLTASIVASVLVCLLFEYLRRRRLREQKDVKSMARELQKEVDEIIRELNSTTERNIELLENALNQARKSIGVLQREEKKHRQTVQVYTELGLKREISVPGRVPEGQLREGPLPENQPPDNPLQKEKAGGGEPAATRPAATIPAGKSSPEVMDFQSLQPRKKAFMQYRNGVSIDDIARNLGMSRGEIQLMISLEERKEV